MSIKIILADDHELLRKGLRSLIKQNDNLEVVGEAANGVDAVQLARHLQPDLVLMDLAMPDLNGIDATRQILQTNPKVKIIGLSMHTNARMVDRMLQAGASAYILKESAFEELLQAIRTIMKGGTYLSPQIARGLGANNRAAPLTGPRSLVQTLSDRELEILKLLAEGWTTKTMADKLLVSPKTVETHRAKIMEKLRLDNIAALTKLALREGLTKLDR